MISLQSTLFVLLFFYSAVLTVCANESYLVNVYGGNNKFCNGVLIQKNAILTGSNCVDGIAQEDIAIVAGDTCDENKMQQFAIKNVYSNDALHLAILQLNNSVTITEDVDIIAQSEEENLKVYNDVKLRGRSNYRNCEVRDFNRIRITRCPANIPKYALCGYSTILRNMFGKGNTGAPYVAFDRTIGKDVLLGIDSNGPYPRKGGSYGPSTTAVFVNTAKDNKWIIETLQDLN